MSPHQAERRHARRVRAWHDMPPALRPLAQEVRAWRTNSSIASFAAHWDLGSRVNAVRSDPHRYGPDGLALLTSYFRPIAARLKDDALVASQFDRDRVIELARREMRSGPHLSWQHMVLLAGVPAGAERERLIELTFASALTVSELRREIGTTADTDVDGVAEVGGPSRPPDGEGRG